MYCICERKRINGGWDCLKNKKIWGCYKKLVCPMTPIDVTNNFLETTSCFSNYSHIS